jgi:ribonuclease J
MIELVRPRAFIPLHGTRVQLDRHRALAADAGIPRTELLENGETAWLGEDGLRRGERVRAGRVRVFAHAEVTEATISDRKALASSGVVVVTLLVDERGALARPPSVASRGVVDPGHAWFTRDVVREIEVALAALGPPHTDERIVEAARLAARRVASKVMGRRPVVLATVVRG